VTRKMKRAPASGDGPEDRGEVCRGIYRGFLEAKIKVKVAPEVRKERKRRTRKWRIVIVKFAKRSKEKKGSKLEGLA